MRVKEGVQFAIIHPRMIPVITAADEVWAANLPGVIPTITSGTDGHHGEDSLHYKGRAFDLRTWDRRGAQLGERTKTILVRCLKAKLGLGFDVVSERTHIHVEYDPK